MNPGSLALESVWFLWGVLLYQRQKRELKVDPSFSAVKEAL